MKNYKCKICKQIFVSRNRMRKHLRKIHGIKGTHPIKGRKPYSDYIDDVIV